MTMLTVLLVVALGCAAVALVANGVNGLITQNSRVTRRLQGSPAAIKGFQEERLVADDSALQSFEKVLTPEDEERASKIRRKLVLAGYRNPSAVRIYFAAKWGVAVAGFLVGALLFAAIMNPEKPLLPIVAVLTVVTLSFFAADMWVERRIAYRRIEIEKSFPDALDLLLVCIEAGHGLDQAIQRVSTEMKSSAAVLCEELRQMVGELRAGKERDRVLSDLAERVNIDDVAAFVTVIKQADKFGVSIAETLRVYGSEMRNKRFMRAEEKANMMPIKLALGAIIFTVPPTILILIGPSIILIAREMMKAAGNGF